MKRIDRLRELIRVARGEQAPDLVLKGGRVLNLFTGEIIRADVALSGGRIAGVGSYDGPAVIDAGGDFISPGFMDAHMHLESTLLSPAELARAVLSRGTTAIMADPHEIANVLGIEGIRFMLEASAGLPVDIYFLLPSCVPATGLETSGACLVRRGPEALSAGTAGPGACRDDELPRGPCRERSDPGETGRLPPAASATATPRSSPAGTSTPTSPPASARIMNARGGRRPGKSSGWGCTS